jgi:hypothetical protein
MSTPGEHGAPGNEFERELELALRLLRSADGRPLGHVELSQAGVAHPGTVIYQLELTGHDIERVYERRRFRGFRLH